MKRLAPFGVAVLAMLGYVRTLAPGLTWLHNGADGGDFAAAAATLGVPHPPGYPTYMLLAQAFAALPIADIAFRLNLLSAVCAALAIGLLCWLVSLVCAAGSQDPLIAIVASAAALCFAFSPVFWSQAVIAEVYTLNALFVVSLLALAILPRCPIWLLCFVFGLGLGNHLSLLLIAPALAILRVSWPLPQWRSLRPVVTRSTLLQGIACLAALLAGAAVYIYLPLRASARPLINWGNADTLDGFLWLISGGPYHSYVFALPLSELAARLSAWVGLLAGQFSWIGIAVMLLGLWDLLATESADGENDDDKAAILRLRLAWASVAVFIVYSVFALSYRTADSYLYLIPAFVAADLWIGRGAYVVASSAIAALASMHSLRFAGAVGSRLPMLVCGCALALLPVLQFADNFSAGDASGDDVARKYVAAAVSDLPLGALVISASDDHTFALWYAQAAKGRSDLLVVDRDLTQFAWYRQQISDLVVGAPPPESYATTDEYVLALVDGLRRQRAVFLTDDDDVLLRRFLWQKQGDMQELVGAAP